MPEYRRSKVEGGTFFFTVVTWHRNPIFIQPESRIILHEVWTFVQARRPFHTDAICLLPDHLHCIWTLPENDSDYSLRWREIKRLFTHQYLAEIGQTEEPNLSHQKRNESAVWQRRFWEHTIRNEEDLNNHINYIHFNPVKHRLVSRPQDWEWSSFHRYIKMGMVDEDWGDEFSSQIRFEFE
jgi:putative transposase